MRRVEPMNKQKRCIGSIMSERGKFSRAIHVQSGFVLSLEESHGVSRRLIDCAVVFMKHSILICLLDICLILQ